MCFQTLEDIVDSNVSILRLTGLTIARGPFNGVKPTGNMYSTSAAEVQKTVLKSARQSLWNGLVFYQFCIFAISDHLLIS